MFCGLKGATDTPRRASARHSPATTVLLPASEVVPWIISVAIEKPRLARFASWNGETLPTRPSTRNAGNMPPHPLPRCILMAPDS
ncbi:hypothetical protein GCM10008997_38130 [Halomonas salifodinae]